MCVWGGEGQQEAACVLGGGSSCSRGMAGKRGCVRIVRGGAAIHDMYEGWGQSVERPGQGIGWLVRVIGL